MIFDFFPFYWFLMVSNLFSEQEVLTPVPAGAAPKRKNADIREVFVPYFCLFFFFFLFLYYLVSDSATSSYSAYTSGPAEKREVELRNAQREIEELVQWRKKGERSRLLFIFYFIFLSLSV